MRFLVLTLVLGCTDNILVPLPGLNVVIDNGSIQGRVCDPSGRTWLADAKAYLNVENEAGVIIDTRIAYSDLDGYWSIDGLPGERNYTYHVQYGPDILTEGTVWIGSGADVTIASPNCFDPLTIDVAVVTGDYDDFHLVLNQMGFANYVLINGQDESELTTFLDSSAELAKYDIIFFNGGFIEDRVIYDLEDTANIAPAQRMANIVSYVENGGNIYASDWAYDVVERGWPERATFVGADEIPDSAQLGNYVNESAMVTDRALSEFLGTEYLELSYDLPVWPAVVGVLDSVSVHLRGDVTYSEGLDTFPLNSVPLLYSFNSGNGKVVFSTFRVARNASEDVVSTLQYMMYRL